MILKRSSRRSGDGVHHSVRGRHRDEPSRRRLDDPGKRMTGGRELDPGTQSRMETGFGVDFGRVRVHTGPAAAALAASEGARAFALGEDLVFGEGQYEPKSARGQHLLAHELAHVVQQSRGGSGAGTEERATAASGKLISGGSVSTGELGGAPRAIQRQPAKGDQPEKQAQPRVIPRQQWSTVLGGFALDSPKPTSVHLKKIDSLVFGVSLHTSMLRDGRASIKVTGHTDRSGTEEHNEGLGQKRADAVKTLLAAALKNTTLDLKKVGEIPATSVGESRPVVPTKDGVQNAENRRVVIDVSIGSVVKPKPKPKFDPSKITIPQETGPLVPRKEPTPDLWKKMQENQRRIEELDRKLAKKKRSGQEIVVNKALKAFVDPILKALPISKDTRETLRGWAKKGLEAGTEKGCDAAIDASPASGKDAEALKNACKAALKSKVFGP